MILERLKRVSDSWRRARNKAIRRAEAAIKEGKLRERGEEERMSQGRRKKKMAGREPVKRWGSINHEVNLLLMVMLASAIRLKQDDVLEAMASTLTMMLSLCSSSICIRSTCLITSSLRTSLSKSSPSVTSLEMAPSIKRAQQAQKTQMLTREERPSINFWCRFFIFHSLISIARTPH